MSGMELRHEFTVPAGADRTWAALTDIEGVAGCFPGATITGAEGGSFEGTVKVKLGPIAMVYKGAGAFVETDREAGRMRIDAKGKDKRGNGTAGADVVAELEPVDDTSTRVMVHTDLSVTGKPAQFGRGVIQDVSDKLLEQFVECLADRIGGGTPGATADEEPTVEEAVAPTGPPGPAVTGPGDAADPAPGDAPPPTPPPGPPPAPQADLSGRPGDDRGDSLDLGAAVLPVLLRSYGKQAAAVLGVLVLLWWVLRRRR